VDRQGVVRTGQRHRVRPAIDVLFPTVAFAFDPPFQGVPIAARHQRLHPLREVRMRRGFAREQEMKPMQQHLPAERRVGVKIIAQQRVVARRVTRRVRRQPALGRGDLAVLLGVPVLRHDELRPQRHHLRVARADDDRRDRAVKMRGRAVGVRDA
jgi:hypothetical protein